MSKLKCPYTYPARSRAAMTKYLADHESYGGWNHPNRRWSPLSWNVKINGRLNLDGKQGEKTNPDFDTAWAEYVAANDSRLWDSIVEDMQRHYLEGEYTTYPGDDQGNWEFCFAGRSGGHMLLTEWCVMRPGGNQGWSLKVDFLRQFEDADAWEQWLGEIEFSTLRTLYRAVRCMDQDFGPGKVEREYEYQLNFQRTQWEEQHAAELVNAKAAEGLEPCPQL